MIIILVKNNMDSTNLAVFQEERWIHKKVNCLSICYKRQKNELKSLQTLEKLRIYEIKYVYNLYNKSLIKTVNNT